MTHQQARTELAAGTPAEAICATCPWDRLCVQPPTMSTAEIDRRIADAEAKDRAKDPFGQQMPATTLMTALVYAGKDSTGTMCPVFTSRLTGPDGRNVADLIRHTMRSWGEPLYDAAGEGD